MPPDRGNLTRPVLNALWRPQKPKHTFGEQARIEVIRNIIIGPGYPGGCSAFRDPIPRAWGNPGRPLMGPTANE